MDEYLLFVTDCVSSNAEFIDSVMSGARELSKHGKWANKLIETGMWPEFDVKKDRHTRLYRKNDYIIFVHSAIEYVYKIER